MSHKCIVECKLFNKSFKLFKCIKRPKYVVKRNSSFILMFLSAMSSCRKLCIFRFGITFKVGYSLNPIYLYKILWLCVFPGCSCMAIMVCCFCGLVFLKTCFCNEYNRAFHHFRGSGEQKEPLKKHPELERLLREKYHSMADFPAKEKSKSMKEDSH